MRKASGRPASKALAAVSCSLAAAGSLVLALALIAEIAAVPTADPGIHSSTWTPSTAAAALVLGQGAFHGSLAIGPVAFGLLLIAVVSLLAGSIGIALIVYALGWQPGPGAAALLGAAWGLAVEILLVNLLCNWLQASNDLYRSLPSWAWFVGMGTWGATLGLALSTKGRRAEPEARLEAPGVGVAGPSPQLSADPHPRGLTHTSPTE